MFGINENSPLMTKEIELIVLLKEIDEYRDADDYDIEETKRQILDLGFQPLTPLIGSMWLGKGTRAMSFKILELPGVLSCGPNRQVERMI